MRRLLHRRPRIPASLFDERVEDLRAEAPRLSDPTPLYRLHSVDDLQTASE